MAATTSEYRLVHPVTGEEQVRFRVTDDVDDDKYLPLIEIAKDGDWSEPDDSSVSVGLYLHTIDGSADCERV